MGKRNHFKKSAVAIAIAQLIATNAMADTYVVNDPGDVRNVTDGKCTLREAIARAKLNDAANGNDCDPTNSAGADLVIFSFPPEELPAPNTINLVTDGPEDLELVIDDDIIISGPNAGNAADLVINWGEEFLSANSILRLQNTAQSATATITVRNLTLNGADGVGQDGGGFKAEADSVVMLDNVVISGNRGTFGGGGYVAPSASVTVSNSLITQNTASSRGGAFSLGKNGSIGGKLTLINSQLTLNHSGSSAGAIYSTGELEVDNSKINANTADASGAAIYAYYGSVMVTNGSDFYTNSAGASGGAIRSFRAPLSVENSSIRSNIAGTANDFTEGGGISFGGNAGDSLTLSNATITNNTASARGGGINIASGIATITDSNITDNLLNRTSAPDSAGGGIFFQGVNLTVKTSSISGNVAQKGGGIYTKQDLYLEDSTIANNSATGAGLGGGGIYHANNRLDIKRTTISGNSAEDGGGILSYAGQLYAENSTISSNSVVSGGAGFSSTQSNFIPSTFTNSTVAFNQGGSGLKLGRGFAKIRNSILSDNDTFDCELIAPGTLNGDTNNIVGTDSGCAAQVSGGSFTYQGINPLLSPLQDNGGPTLTHGLCRNSPAIDKGDNLACGNDSILIDQRGEARDLACDIGAYESIVDLICETGIFFTIPLPDQGAVIFEL